MVEIYDIFELLRGREWRDFQSSGRKLQDIDCLRSLMQSHALLASNKSRFECEIYTKNQRSKEKFHKRCCKNKTREKCQYTVIFTHLTSDLYLEIRT